MTTLKTSYPSTVVWITNPKAQVYFAVISLCLIVFYSATVYVYRPNDNIGWSASLGGLVVDVTEKGAQDPAFLRPNDRVLEIDGAAVDPWMQRPFYRPFLHPGDAVTYKILRDGQEMLITATIGSYLEVPAFLASLLIGVFLSLCFWMTGTILCVFAHPNDVRARLIGAAWLLAGVTVITGKVATEGQFWGYAILMKIGFCLLAFVLLALHLYFPKPSFRPALRQWIVRFAAVIAMILVCLTLVDDLYIKPQFDVWSRFSLLAYSSFLVSALLSIALLFRNCFLTHDPETRRQTGIVIFGTILGFAPFLILDLIPALLFSSYLVRTVYTLPFLLLIPLSYAYVIYQGKLLQIDWVINRLLVLFVVILLILLLSIAIFGGLSAWLGFSSQTPLWNGLLTAVLVISTTSLQKHVQVGVDRILYGTHYDHALVTFSLSSRLAETLDLPTLTDLLTQCFPKQMGIRRSALLLLRDEELYLHSGPGTFSTQIGDPVCATLLTAGVPLRAQNLWGLVPEAAQEAWRPLAWGAIFAPIVFKNQLHGILILGDRVANDLYSERDIHIIAAVAAQAAVACDNVELVDSLRGYAQQTIRTEEEMHLRVGRDLHDVLLQDLLFVRQSTTDPEMIKHLQRLTESLQRIIKAQRIYTLEGGIVTVLEGMVRDMRKSTGGQGAGIAWQSNICTDLLVDDELKTSIYRIAHEALTNAIRHARAYNIRVSLEKKQDKLKLCIQDDGKGMKTCRSPRDHYGLTIIRERAFMIDADLKIHSAPNEGTTVMLEVPL